jgi:hypothetical protein
MMDVVVVALRMHSPMPMMMMHSLDVLMNRPAIVNVVVAVLVEMYMYLSTFRIPIGIRRTEFIGELISDILLSLEDFFVLYL